MKKISLTRQLKAANERISILEVELAKSVKQVESEKNSKDYYSKTANQYQEELQAMHMLLDALPNSPSKEIEQKYGSKELNITTRLSVWLASR